MLLSLFSGCGGLDLGFEQVGFRSGLAYDLRPSAIASWNLNRPDFAIGRVQDIFSLNLATMDEHFGSEFTPNGVIGGPPCQSFSIANSQRTPHDPRTRLVNKFFSLSLDLHHRKPLDFVVMENVPGLATRRHRHILDYQIRRLRKAGFLVSKHILDAAHYGVPQRRKRLIVVAYNPAASMGSSWDRPKATSELPVTVREAIGVLSEPTQFKRGLDPASFPEHPNHWCMVPKSEKFFDGSLNQGGSFGRSFKTLMWDEPSYTVSYGHREVHVHPNGKRRLSVFEAMKLQGFPKEFVLSGNLSQQITQVSEAVPPPLGKAIAERIADDLSYPSCSRASAA
ncbi:MAG: DNA cytosine methyltransferase [Pseudomonadota bacterium]